jgi:2-polyprenyl-3-methyl-5-hydroxy-6-metoxy-1,4-benzoquinol methylase
MNAAPELCILCGSQQREPLMEKDGWKVFKCGGCGLGFLDPRPSPEELTELYDQGYFEAHCLEGGELGSAPLKRRLRLEDWRLRLLRRFKPRGKVLDIGCGYGYFLAACREEGYQVHGIDCSGFAVRHAMEKLQLNVTIGALDEIHMPAHGYDVVTFWHCLEHLRDPRQAVDKAAAWLKPDGLLIVEVPNHESTDARRIGADWVGWSLPHHLFHFTPHSLSLLLKQHGFQIMKSNDFHSETVKESLKRIPIINLLARPIATFYSGHSIAVVARRIHKR